jgi:hypothetical protein
MLINYTYIDHRFIRWLEKVGALVYQKYFFRGFKAYIDMARRKPMRFATFEGMESLLDVDWQGPEDTWEHFFHKIKNRFYIGDPLHMVDEATNVSLFHIGFDVGSFLK